MSFSHQLNTEVLASAEFQSLRNGSPLLSLLDILKRSGFVSASKWNQDYFDALQVHLALDQPPESVVPDAFFPTDEELDMHSEMFMYSTNDLKSEHFVLKNIRDLSRGFYSRLLNVIQAGSTDSLSSVCSTSPVSSVSSSRSGSSTATDKAECVSEDMLRELLRYWVDDGKVFSIGGRQLFLSVRTEPIKHGVQFCRRRISVVTDGYLSVSDRGDKAKTLSSAVCAFIEAKRHCHRKTDQAILAQIAGEVISVAQYNQSRRPHATPESFGFMVHHRKCSIVSGVFSPNYLANLENGTGPTVGDYLILKRTVEYDIG
ncbi:uncharacterized protein SPPG_02390 [Spizellomyces punctatus DAOM BR117]|uniref:Uncharacterized protein n=1 Tax=Spizellomyces punctatus (strain DAOM BR117) TaxID=645134 RepID=A0A0L0HQF8_SPIPD|nr:uncharacterized protein SPPG_02390 [Spizellomyces punctatus DAOM BR117]KND03347.1 hypothetical protein SPPG_02390 [Spizellomyces punctatus DAOM BR117]|eukprot:XP_016611386.1 hypothetical protein SPPG_02390 [Spizellomyces punctatus DAOM BR117]